MTWGVPGMDFAGEIETAFLGLFLKQEQAGEISPDLLMEWQPIPQNSLFPSHNSLYEQVGIFLVIPGVFLAIPFSHFTRQTCWIIPFFWSTLCCLMDPTPVWCWPFVSQYSNSYIFGWINQIFFYSAGNQSCVWFLLLILCPWEQSWIDAGNPAAALVWISDPHFH